MIKAHEEVSMQDLVAFIKKHNRRFKIQGVVHLGQRNTGQTDLLALKTLHMHLSADARLVLGPEFLAHCPKVDSVELQDTTLITSLRK